MKAETVKTVAATLASVGLVLLVLQLQKPSAPEDPRKAAHEISLWMNTLQLRHAEERGELMETLILQRKEYIPILVQQMGANQSHLKSMLRRAVEHLPDSVRDSLDIKKDPDTYRAGAAWGLLYVLRGRDNFAEKVDAEEAKVLIPALRMAARDESIYVRLNAAACLGAFDPADGQVRELILKALRDKHHGIRYNAAYALWASLREEQKVTRFLDEALGPDEPDLRSQALENFKKVLASHSKEADPADTGPGDFE